MNFYNYELVRKSDGRVVYVGKGKGRRMHFHKWNVMRGFWKHQHKLYTLLKALIDSGDDFFERKVFESDNEWDVLQKEAELINHYGIENLYNGVSGPLFGAISSEKATQVRQAISKARMGMKFSDAHREHIRQAVLRRPPRTPEQRLNQSLGQIGVTHKKHSNALSPNEKREHRLGTYRRYYQSTRDRQLATKKAQNDAFRLQQWQSTLATRGLPSDTPMPPIAGPLAALTPDQRQERKRARERINHGLRRAKAAGDHAEIDRLTAERRRLDSGLAESIVNSLL